MQTDIRSEAESFFGFTEIGPLVKSLVDVALVISGILVFLYLVWGGIEWITSGGEKAHVENAQKRITASVIGLAIVAASWAIWLIVRTYFGLEEALPIS